jgi:hypothetical protein
VVLAATDVQAPSYQELLVGASGEIERPRGPVSTFKGHVAGVPESDVRLLVHPELLMGYVELEGRRFFIEPAYRFVPGGGTTRVVIYEDGDLRPGSRGPSSTRPCRLERVFTHRFGGRPTSRGPR